MLSRIYVIAHHTLQREGANEVKLGEEFKRVIDRGKGQFGTTGM
jgi:hypothetical protein